jgi:peptidoglycan hydrolase-like protein with peptidoglycan-binding domain
MAFSNALCWTNSTFSQSGDELASDSNLFFDLTYFSQLLLQLRHIDPGIADGEMGPKTREGIREFQRRLGLEQTGDVTEDLFWRMLDAAGGAQEFAAQVKAQIYDQNPPEFDDIIWGGSDQPMPKMTFSEDLAGRSESDRLLALAAVLAVGESPCSLPAISATLLGDAADGMWNVTCAEGNYTLVLSEGSRTVIAGSSELEEEPASEPKAPKRPQGKTK